MVSVEIPRGQGPDSKSPVRRFVRWFLGTDELEQARAVDPTATTPSAPHLRRAHLAFELADRALDDIEPLKHGPGSALAISLLREATYWALTARSAGTASKSLADAFDTAARDALINAAGSDASVQGIRATLVERTFVETAELPPKVQEREARNARAFTAALIASLEQPSPALIKIAARRHARFALAAALGVGLLLLGLWIGKKTGPQLKWRTSSQSECDVLFGYCSGRSVDLIFHTAEEDSPWAELDLGRLRTFSSIQVHNREDCCRDRALPLVVQVSNDRNSWKEIGRQTTDFELWNLAIAPESARYLRFLVERRSILHLKKVTVQ